MVYKGYICLSGYLSRKDSSALEESPQDLSAGKKGFCQAHGQKVGRPVSRQPFMQQACLLSVCLSQVELEMEALKKQQASAADSSFSATKEEVGILRLVQHTHHICTHRVLQRTTVAEPGT